MADFILLAILCAGVGAVVGVLSGLIGIGGGIIMVPFIILAFDDLVPGDAIVPFAVSTSLCSVFLTTVSTAQAQIRRNAVHWPVIRIWILPMMIGGLFASQAAPQIDGVWLISIISAFLIYVSFSTLWSFQPGSRQRCSLPGWPKSASLAVGIGFLSALTGIGGSILVTPTLAHYGLSIIRAAATASALAAPMAFAGTVGFVWVGWNAPGLPAWSLGYVHLPAVGGIAPMSMLAAPLGVALAHRMPILRLRRIFSIILLIISGVLIWRGYVGF